MSNKCLVFVWLAVAFACLATLGGAYYDRQKFKEICLNDTSNDDAIHMNAVSVWFNLLEAREGTEVARNL